MIKIKGYKNKEKESLEFDLYVPINIEFQDDRNNNHEKIYWRTGDLNDSMLEVGIENNVIKTVTLLICKNVYIEKKVFDSLESEEGFPLLNFPQKERKVYYDEQSILDIYIENDSIYILFSDAKAKNCIVNNRVSFLIDENKNWIGLKISRVNSWEMTMFIESLG